MEGEGDCGDCHLETLVLPACCQASPFPGYHPCKRHPLQASARVPWLSPLQAARLQPGAVLAVLTMASGQFETFQRCNVHMHVHMRVHMHMRLYPACSSALQARALITTSGVPDCIVSWFELALGGGK